MAMSLNLLILRLSLHSQWIFSKFYIDSHSTNDPMSQGLLLPPLRQVHYPHYAPAPYFQFFCSFIRSSMLMKLAPMRRTSQPSADPSRGGCFLDDAVFDSEVLDDDAVDNSSPASSIFFSSFSFSGPSLWSSSSQSNKSASFAL
mmetsp:Transcript_99/g.143  ORF Transcript_99/g.143 Transcript_99/m.143 type:complete len:144 (-) Transcript_99:619-1050(-)